MTIQNNTNITCNWVLPNLFGFTIFSQSSRKITRFVLCGNQKKGEEERKIFVCICLHCYQINTTKHCQQNISIITCVVDCGCFIFLDPHSWGFLMWSGSAINRKRFSQFSICHWPKSLNIIIICGSHQWWFQFIIVQRIKSWLRKNTFSSPSPSLALKGKHENSSAWLFGIFALSRPHHPKKPSKKISPSSPFNVLHRERQSKMGEPIACYYILFIRYRQTWSSRLLTTVVSNFAIDENSLISLKHW